MDIVLNRKMEDKDVEVVKKLMTVAEEYGISLDSIIFAETFKKDET